MEGRLLAATRLLAAKYQSEVEGRTLGELGDWDRPLSKANEVGARGRGFGRGCQHACAAGRRARAPLPAVTPTAPTGV